MKGIVIMMKQYITQVQYATDIQDGAIETRAVTMRCMCKKYEACFLFLLEPHQLLSNLLCFGNFLISVPIGYDVCYYGHNILDKSEAVRWDEVSSVGSTGQVSIEDQGSLADVLEPTPPAANLAAEDQASEAAATGDFVTVAPLTPHHNRLMK